MMSAIRSVEWTIPAPRGWSPEQYITTIAHGAEDRRTEAGLWIALNGIIDVTSFLNDRATGSNPYANLGDNYMYEEMVNATLWPMMTALGEVASRVTISHLTLNEDGMRDDEVRLLSEVAARQSFDNAYTALTYGYPESDRAEALGELVDVVGSATYHLTQAVRPIKDYSGPIVPRTSQAPRSYV